MQQKLQEYAELLINVGLNIQKGQELYITVTSENAPFARLCAKAAYDIGCRQVITDLSDEPLVRLEYLYAEDSVFDQIPQWQVDKMNGMAERGAGRLAIADGDPELLKGINPDRIRRRASARGKQLDQYFQAQLSNAFPWCVAAVPTPAWAKLVFPDMTEADAMAALWDAIFTAVRVSGDGTAVQRWREHTERTAARCRQLNSYQFQSLRYTNSLGTDLHIGLPEDHLWLGGSEESKSGHAFVANIPTEEIFTAPRRDAVSGRVVSSMPFSMQGTVVHPFALTLENGKIVSVEAETEAERLLLENHMDQDEGGRFLGEVALVPYDSPIRNLGILFYNTLFDENAACHLAFGAGYPCIEGGQDMDKDALLARGINQSNVHVDFMIGTKDLSITGVTADGREVPVFTDGNFAF